MTGDLITALTVFGALAVLGIGFYRARPYGRLGIFSWLQSVALMAPWLVFFGLFTAGVYLNLVGILILLILSSVGYIVLGRTVRSLAQAEIAKQATTLVPPKQVPSEQAPSEQVPSKQTTTDHKAAIGTAASSMPTDTKTADTASTGRETDHKTEVNTDAKTATPLPPGIATLPPIPAADLALIKGIFGIDTFFATETIPYQDGAVFNGNLRTDADAAYAKLSQSLADRVGDRYRLFLVENANERPTVIVLPQTADPQQSQPWQKGVAVLLFGATIATCLETAGFLLGFDFYQAPQRYREVLPLGLGSIAVLVAHEIGHWAMARKYQVKLSWPFFLPTWQIGSFGALTRFESLLPNRSVLFDIALAGPAAGGILSLVFLLAGFALSHPGSTFTVPTIFFEGSILVGTLAKVILQASLQQKLVDVHPFVIVGWIGLLITAINLMPAGRLDGGRIVQAIYGRTMANRTTIATLILLTVVSLVNPLALYWAILILFLQRNLERPTLNDIPEPDDARAALALLALFLMVVILLPLSPSLAGRLGIGG
jgi:membrane-associated protease RseP (regulator of RpoE activity)